MRTKRIKRQKSIKKIKIVSVIILIAYFIYLLLLINTRCEVIIKKIQTKEQVVIANQVIQQDVKPIKKAEKVEVKTIDNKIDDRELLARLLYTEARGESIECQRAVVSVVLNRVKASGNTIEQVIKAPGQFDLGNKLDNIKPLQTQYEVVDYVLANGITIPEDVTYFRSGHFHSFAEDYKQIGNMYFSR